MAYADHRQRPSTSVPGKGSGLLASGGVIAALAASSCCILPLVLFGAGIGGAWIGRLTALAPYQPYFIAFALVCLGAGFWRVYRKRAKPCGDDGVCARPLPDRLTKGALWLAALMIIAALGFNELAPLVLSY